jgi:hypothetical protein
MRIEFFAQYAPTPPPVGGSNRIPFAPQGYPGELAIRKESL